MAEGKKHWIQGAVNPKHKGFCTPMTKSTCTPRRKALARTFKKHHGFHAEGGVQGNVNPYATGAGMLGNFTSNIAGDNTGASMAGGMLSGAASGAALGPVGIGTGVLIGGVTSLLGSGVKKQKQLELERAQKAQNDNMRNQKYLSSLPQQQSYQSTFRCGGKVYSLGGLMQGTGSNINYSIKYPVGGTVPKKPLSVADTTSIPVDTTLIDTMKPTRQRLALFKNVNDPELYKSIEDPSKDISPYFSAMLESSAGKSNPYTETYLNNVNRRFGKNMGYYYDPSKGSLRTILPGTPRYSELENSYKQYDLQGPTEGRALGGGALGVKAYGGYIDGNAELEQGEPYRTPDGQIHQISNNAPTHAQGGVQMNLPQGTEILGKMTDPVMDEEFKEIGQQLKKAQDKYTKIIENKPTPLAKKTAGMMLQKVQNKYDELMQRQEAMKSQQEQQQQFACGGYLGGIPTQYAPNTFLPKYTRGGELTGQGVYSWDVQDPLYEADAQPTYMMNQNVQDASTPTTVPFTPGVDTFTNFNPQSNKSNSTWDKIGKGLETAGTFAPIVYNLGQGMFGKADTLDASNYQNEYDPQIRSLMSGRKYNVDPELEANRLSMSTYLQNLRKGAPSQGRYLSGVQAGMVSKQRADAEAYARKQNVENQYKAEEAQSLSTMGDRAATTRANVEDINARRKATQRSYLPTALSQLQQAAFVGKQTKMQKLRDKQKLGISKELYKNYPFDLTKLYEED